MGRREPAVIVSPLTRGPPCLFPDFRLFFVTKKKRKSRRSRMARLVRADLEALLRTRQLDVTLTTVRPWLEDGTGQPDRVIPTGLPAFDGRLGGGVPRGQVSAVAGAASSGRTS